MILLPNNGLTDLTFVHYIVSGKVRTCRLAAPIFIYAFRGRYVRVDLRRLFLSTPNDIQFMTLLCVFSSFEEKYILKNYLQMKFNKNLERYGGKRKLRCIGIRRK